jgi:hypothetical protein
MAKQLAKVGYPLSLVSGLILLLWGVWRLIVFDPSTYSPSIATWRTIAGPMVVINCIALVIAYLFQRELDQSSFKLPTRVVIGLLSVVAILWFINVGVEVLLGPISAG